MKKTSEPNIPLILSVQRALFRAIPKNTKAVYAKISDNFLIWKIYFDEKPSEEEKDILSVALAEIISDFPEIISAKEQYIHHPEPLDFKNTTYHEWPYSRFEK